MNLIQQIQAAAKIDGNNVIELTIKFTRTQAESEEFGREIIRVLEESDKSFNKGYLECLKKYDPAAMHTLQSMD